jgi:hypothetical protein
MRKRLLGMALAAAVVSAAPAIRADQWDVGADNDNDSGSDNELVHGLDQVHDVEAQAAGTVEDVDWYHFNHGCNASFEILLDSLTGGVSNGTVASPALDLIDSDGTTVLATSTPVTGLGVARRLIYPCEALFPVPEMTHFVRISNPACGLSCTANARYRIRFYETTALLPRFNNANGQVTVLVLQNSTDVEQFATGMSFDSTGAILDDVVITLPPSGVTTVNLAIVDGGVLNNKAGALKLLNTAPYGALAGKAVALEPATGFTFDTPLVYKPH